MAKNPFKVGDKVYVYPYGWGEVNEYSTHTLKSHVIFPNKICGEWADTKLISFTEYDPIKGGLSHERPEEKKRPTVDTSKFYDPDDFNRNYCVNREVNRESPSDNPIWSPMQYMTIDAIGEKLQEHDRILKGVSGAIDELKKVKVDGKIKLSDIWPISPDFKKRFVSGGIPTGRVTLSIDLVRRK